MSTASTTDLSGIRDDEYDEELHFDVDYDSDLDIFDDFNDAAEQHINLEDLDDEDVKKNYSNIRIVLKLILKTCGLGVLI